jgi:hypothetical protein
VQGKKLNNKVGGDAHESVFGADDRETRKRKVMIAPSINTNAYIKFEQAWNKASEKKDVVKVSIGEVYAIVERSFLEQALASMCQGDEIIKYTAPTLDKI